MLFDYRISTFHVNYFIIIIIFCVSLFRVHMWMYFGRRRWSGDGRQTKKLKRYFRVHCYYYYYFIARATMVLPFAFCRYLCLCRFESRVTYNKLRFY